MSGFQVAPAEIEARAARASAPSLDCAVFGVADERAGEVPVAAVQLDPGAAVDGRRAHAARGRLARHLQAPAPCRAWSTRSRGCRRARCCAGPCASSGRRARLGRARGGLMDVRLSAEQVALRDSVAQVVGRLGPRTVAELDDAERAGEARRRRRRVGLARTARGRRRRRTVGLRRSRSAIVAEELGRGLADAAVLGPTLASELRRHGRRPGRSTARRWRSEPDLWRPAAFADGALEAGAVAHRRGAAPRRAGARPRTTPAPTLVPVPAGCGPDRRRGLTSTRVAVDVRRPSRSGSLARRAPSTADDLDRWTAWGSPSPAPTSSE